MESPFLAVLGEPGWRLLLEAGTARDAHPRDPLAAATDLARRRPDAPADRRAAALELVTEGARLAAKLGLEERLLAVRGAVEQASAGRVATWHAQQVPAGARVLEVGCGCGGDSLALAHRAGNLLAADLDPVRAACAHLNLTALGLGNARALVGEGLALLAGEARRAEVVFVDPDRRPAGRRSLDPEAWSPPLAALARLAEGPRQVLVKAAPALDPERALARFDVSFLSHGGECVEAFLSARRAGPGQVRAVRLPDDGPSELLAGERGEAPAGPVGDAIYVPDPAAVRARLLAELCVRHGLVLAGPGIALLSGPPAVASPWLVEHRVLEVAGIERVPAALRARGAGAVQVHVRGLPLRAPELERRWSARGGGRAPLDVFCVRTLDGPKAVLAERASVGA